MILNDEISQSLSKIYHAHRLKECYELRTHLLRSNHSNKSTFDRNETEIIGLETYQKICALNTIIHKQKEQFINTFNDFVKLAENEYRQSSDLPGGQR